MDIVINMGTRVQKLEVSTPCELGCRIWQTSDSSPGFTSVCSPERKSQAAEQISQSSEVRANFKRRGYFGGLTPCLVSALSVCDCVEMGVFLDLLFDRSFGKRLSFVSSKVHAKTEVYTSTTSAF